MSKSVEQAVQILEKLEGILQQSMSLAQYRRLVSEAVHAGDLDPSGHTFEAANARAKSFIEGGGS